jgi:hypothetical protein
MEDIKEKLGCLGVSLVIGGIIYYFIFYCSTHGTKTERTTIEQFKIEEYEFEVDYVVKTDISTGKIKKEYYDTILNNICDFCEDCEQDVDYDPIRR